MKHHLSFAKLLVIAFFVILSLNSTTGCVSTAKKASPEKIAEAHVGLASEYFLLGRMAPALAAAKKAERADPESVDANLLLALIYQNLEQASKAEEYFTSAVDLVDEDSEDYGVIHNNYAVFLCQQGQHLDADEHFILAIQNKLYRSPEKAYENAGICSLKRGDKAQAEKYFKEAVSLSPRMPRSLFELAKIQYDAGKFLSSRGYLQRYHQLRAESAKSLYLEIKIELKLKSVDLANKLIKDLVNRFPDSPEAKIVK